MISRHRSAPIAVAMSIECTTSANSTVTCLYSARVSFAVTGTPQASQNCEFARQLDTACRACQFGRRHGIASAHAICPSKPSVFAMSR